MDKQTNGRVDDGRSYRNVALCIAGAKQKLSDTSEYIAKLFKRVQETVFLISCSKYSSKKKTLTKISNKSLGTV